MTVLTNAQLETVVAPQLERLGFRRRRGGVYGLDQLELRCADHWLTIECEDAPSAPLGSPATSGLWRDVRDRGGTRRRVFDLPVEAFLNEPDDEISETSGDNLPLTACLRWALVAPRGGLGASDTLPPLDVIDSHLQGHMTTARGRHRAGVRRRTQLGSPHDQLSTRSRRTRGPCARPPRMADAADHLDAGRLAHGHGHETRVRRPGRCGPHRCPARRPSGASPRVARERARECGVGGPSRRPHRVGCRIVDSGRPSPRTVRASSGGCVLNP